MKAIDIGSHVAYLRKQRGWSLRDLSAAAQGLSVSYLSDIEHGRTVPSIESVEKLACAFDMTMPVFFGGADLKLTLPEHAILNAYRARDLRGVIIVALSGGAA